MTDETKAAPAAQPVAAAKPVAAKPPKKLIPRPAPKPVTKVVAVEASPAADPEMAAPATAAATAKARPARKPTREDETVAKHQKILADALAKAQAINYDQPKVMKQEPAIAKKAAKPAKAKKPKLVRDSYAMPEAEYARIGELKKRLAVLGSDVKKSELLRGGIALLAALNDTGLQAVMGRVERIKTGRPTSNK